jgi:hypothetical protein
VVGLSVGAKLITAPAAFIARYFGWSEWGMGDWSIHFGSWSLATPASMVGALLMVALGIVVLTALMHAARGIARGHARLAKALLVEPGA